MNIPIWNPGLPVSPFLLCFAFSLLDQNYISLPIIFFKTTSYNILIITCNISVGTSNFVAFIF